MAIFQIILNGISNLYVNNLMLPLPRGKRSIRTSEASSVNWSLTYCLCGGKPHHHPLGRSRAQHWWGFLVFIPLAQLCGLLLKVIYIKFFSPHLEFNLDKGRYRRLGHNKDNNHIPFKTSSNLYFLHPPGDHPNQANPSTRPLIAFGATFVSDGIILSVIRPQHSRCWYIYLGYKVMYK